MRGVPLRLGPDSRVKGKGAGAPRLEGLEEAQPLGVDVLPLFASEEGAALEGWGLALPLPLLHLPSLLQKPVLEGVLQELESFAEVQGEAEGEDALREVLRRAVDLLGVAPGSPVAQVQLGLGALHRGGGATRSDEHVDLLRKGFSCWGAPGVSPLGEHGAVRARSLSLCLQKGWRVLLHDQARRGVWKSLVVGATLAVPSPELEEHSLQTSGGDHRA